VNRTPSGPRRLAGRRGPDTEPQNVPLLRTDERMDHPMRTRGPHKLLLALSLVTEVASLPGCNTEAPTPPVGSAEFEKAREEYQNVRRQEYGVKSLDPKEQARSKSRVK
jgi:hypothetical protein